MVSHSHPTAQLCQQPQNNHFTNTLFPMETDCVHSRRKGHKKSKKGNTSCGKEKENPKNSNFVDVNLLTDVIPVTMSTKLKRRKNQ